MGIDFRSPYMRPIPDHNTGESPWAIPSRSQGGSRTLPTPYREPPQPSIILASDQITVEVLPVANIVDHFKQKRKEGSENFVLYSVNVEDQLEAAVETAEDKQAAENKRKNQESSFSFHSAFDGQLYLEQEEQENGNEGNRKRKRQVEENNLNLDNLLNQDKYMSPKRMKHQNT